MEENRRMLILRLEGPLQSWGDMSKWDYRDTGDFPTKSGIVGLLGCALGLEREAPELTTLAKDMILAVRADRPGNRFVDFQTVTGSPLRNAEGNARSLGNTFISNRVYLQDACFTVFLELPEEWHSRIVAALKQPRWCMYLGRKSCVPSRPVLECAAPRYNSLDDAMRQYPVAVRVNYPMTYETEQKMMSDSSYSRPDQWEEGYRTFSRRRVWRGIIKEGDHVSVET